MGPVLPWACGDGMLMLPGVELGAARMGIIWAPPAAIVSLSSFVGVWMGFVT